MNWGEYSKLKGTHAFCSASKTSWRNYTPEKLMNAKMNSYAAEIGTLLHAYAEENIKKHFKVQKSDKHGVLRYLTVENYIPSYAVDIDRLFPNLMNYVNDCIGFRMRTEEVVYYSENFYGTCDAISYKDDILRISDLKTGVSQPSFVQLENYAAFFCLHHKVKPTQIKKLEFRIYHNGEIDYAEPEPAIIFPIMDQIIEFDNYLKELERR